MLEQLFNLPIVASLPDGGFVIVWHQQDSGFHIKRFSATGMVTGESTIAISQPFYPYPSLDDPGLVLDNFLPLHPIALAATSQGWLMLLWVSLDPLAVRTGIFGMVITPEGARDGEDYEIDTDRYDEQYEPTLSVLQGDAVFTAWQSNDFIEKSHFDIQTRLFK